MNGKDLVLIEQINPAAANMIIEQNDKTKHSYLSGIMVQGDLPNGNGRTYPLNEIQSAVDNINERIKGGFSVFGELNHPENLQIDLNNVSHIITEMWVDGKNGYGKARIIDEHPKGQIVKAILNAGGKLGVSSRGSGNVNEGRVSQFQITTIDIVANPSAPDAYPSHIMEQLADNKKIMTLAESVIHDDKAQKYFKKELAIFFEILTGQQIKRD